MLVLGLSSPSPRCVYDVVVVSPGAVFLCDVWEHSSSFVVCPVVRPVLWLSSLSAYFVASFAL